jgi:large subunit ribosomal protein L16
LDLSQKKLKKSFIRRAKLTNQSSKPSLNFGSVGLVALQQGRVSTRQLESTRKVLRRSLRKEAKTWITVFPQMPITKKPQEVRMGKGKGKIKS